MIDLVLLLVAKYRKFKWKKDQNGKHTLDNGSDAIGVTLGQLAMIGTCSFSTKNVKDLCIYSISYAA